MRFDGKVILISGGARGMGLSHTRAFIAEGGRVVSFDVNEDAGEALAREFGEDRLLFTRGDVSSADDWRRIVRAGMDRFGRIDVLVNNAGISPLQSLETVTEEEYRRVIDINQVGTYLGMQAVIPAMKQAGGAIVNISSSAGIVGFTDIFPYVASKWAVRGMTKAAALELAPYGIRVNAVCPGDTDTPMIQEQSLVAAAGTLPPQEDLPLGRWARPEEISAAVLFLASDDSSYMSGSEVVVDGAYTAR